jgi:hypothetical protein
MQDKLTNTMNSLVDQHGVVETLTAWLEAAEYKGNTVASLEHGVAICCLTGEIRDMLEPAALESIKRHGA